MARTGARTRTPGRGEWKLSIVLKAIINSLNGVKDALKGEIYRADKDKSALLSTALRPVSEAIEILQREDDSGTAAIVDRAFEDME